MATIADHDRRTIDWPRLLSVHALLFVGATALFLPTIASLGVGPWSTEAGVHGPLVLATGIWLIVRRSAEIRAAAQPGSLGIAVAAMAVAVIGYTFGRAFDFISVEVASMLLAYGAVAYSFLGAAVLRLMWFPIVYLAFMIPIPGSVLDTATQPLKAIVSQSVTSVLGSFGYPVARVGVTIYVAQYQLLVEDACAGLNSLISLTAIGLFYVYVMRNTNWRYSVLLLILVLPIAILANCIRVAALVLLTYYFGDAVAQGFLHKFAGMVTFTSALLFIFLIDALLSPVRTWLEKAR
ncbi:exosortase V [Polymorphobacter sp. PAMC 29334]|uniref:exosortase V n=1 Tax=Polymorphobacter sp. PAMC 29334 TaxID=2862331 RepID=UPI001D02BF67|nr:exosortase V [Polymorphobacter sp. PAMC 29334]